MSRIRYGKNPPHAFHEDIDFEGKHPYYLRIKTFTEEELIPSHFSEDVLEIILYKKAKGKFMIGDREFTIREDQDDVFVIPPGTVHSDRIMPCDGIVYTLHVSLKYCANFVDIQNILAHEGYRTDDLLFSKPRYNDLVENFERLIRHDDNLFRCMSELIIILETVCGKIPKFSLPVLSGELRRWPGINERLTKLLLWTSRNYFEPLSLEDAAGEMDLTKAYFCTWFKKLTGMTYRRYLNRIRISHACQYLGYGKPVLASALACGFDDFSYFCRLFKKITGSSPREFVHRWRAGAPEA
jgi:AraC-like DNA-binding protein